MATPEVLPTREAAIEAALAEIRQCLLGRVFVCCELFATSQRINVYERRRGPGGTSRKVTKRFRWNGGGA